MALNLYLPPASTLNPLHRVPVLIFLSGLTCTPDNCSEKGFFQHMAAQRGISIVYPDTSPREFHVIALAIGEFPARNLCQKRLISPFGTGGLKIQGEDDASDFGTGAGFYVDATKEPWSKGYKMYSYITDELPKALFDQFKQLDDSRVSITGHSMGGHGALTLVCCPWINA